MRETLLEKAGGGTMRVVTDDRGTDVLGSGDRVVATYGSDRHDEMVEEYQGEGWGVARDGAVAPEAVAGAPPPNTGPAEDDPTATVNAETS